MPQAIVLVIVLLMPIQALADAIDDALAKAGFVEEVNPNMAAHRKQCDARDYRDPWMVKKHGGPIRIIRESQCADKECADRLSPLPQKFEFSTRHMKYLWDIPGEYGGKLQAVWPDKHRKILLKKNVAAIIPSEGFLYVFTARGMRGAVYKISDFDKDPKISLVTLLPGKPLVPLLDSRRDDAFIIITCQGLLALRPNVESLMTIEHHSLWEGLWPNSAVQAGNRILVGFCTSVAVIEFHNSYDLLSIKMFVKKTD